MTARWDATAAITALLDALEAELLGASKEEMHAALRETGRARDSACQELPALLDDATAADEDASPALTPYDLGDRPDLHRQ